MLSKGRTVKGSMYNWRTCLICLLLFSNLNLAKSLRWNSTRALHSLMREASLDSPSPPNFKSSPSFGSHRHNALEAVIGAAYAVPGFTGMEGRLFVETLRKTGYKGDIVVFAEKTMRSGFSSMLKEFNVIVYQLDLDCTGEHHSFMCKFKSVDMLPRSLNVLRWYMYKWVAQQYSSDATIILSDFRDVFFQSNPFLYRTEEWKKFQLTVFQEHHPSKIIKRCPFNSGWISDCYGSDALNLIGDNTVSCSGIVIGKRDAIFGYTHLMVSQLDVSRRYGWREPSASLSGGSPQNSAERDKLQKRCKANGIDQAFHNWLLYSGILLKYMSIKVSLFVCTSQRHQIISLSLSPFVI